MTLTKGLIEIIEAKPITDGDLRAAALYVIDTLANVLAGRESVPGQRFLDWYRTAGTDAGRQALVMGALAHTLETDDLHRASVVHPGCVVIPAAWAEAKRRRANGRAFLCAVLKGYEAACRVGMAVGPAHYRIWHNTATCGPFGSAYAAGTLMDLDVEALVSALGNAGTQSAGLWEFLESGAMSKHLHAGRAAEAGVVAAELAEFGFSGPPAILEGDRGFFRATCPDGDPRAVLHDPDAPWQLLATSLKPWPSCRHTHPAIDAAAFLRTQGPVAQIESIRVETYPAALEVCDRPAPVSEYEAKFSLQHCVAAALSIEEVDFGAFDLEHIASLSDLRGKVSCRIAEPYSDAYPRDWGSAVSVLLLDGTLHRAERRHARGDPECPLSPEEVVHKARSLMSFGGVEEVDALLEALHRLTEGGPLPDLSLT